MKSWDVRKRITFLREVWGEMSVGAVEFARRVLDEERLNKVNSSKDPSSVAANTLAMIAKSPRGNEKIFESLVDELLNLASAKQVEVARQDLKEAILSPDDAVFLRFALNKHQYAPASSELVTSGIDRFEAEHHVSDFELFASKDTLKGNLGTFRETVLGVFDEDLEAARQSRHESDGEDGLIRRCAFLYRLGVEDQTDGMAVAEDEKTSKYSFNNRGFGLVIRRVPACFIIDPEDPYRVKYEEYYTITEEEQKAFGIERAAPRLYTANAYAYAFSDCLAILSKDKVRRNATRPSLTQLDWRKGQNMDEPLLPGVIAMESDLFKRGSHTPPTAYRVVIRILNEKADWEKLKNMSYTKLLIDEDDGESFSPLDRQKWDSETCDFGMARHWGEYFDMLNICENPLDLLVAREVKFADGFRALPDRSAS